MDVLHFVFGVFGGFFSKLCFLGFWNVFALFLFLAPTITFKRIVTKKSTEQFSGIPYVMTLLNCLLSAWYGLPFVSPNNILVSTINGTGAVIETVYVLVFIIYSPKREKLKISGLFAFVITVFAIVALVSLFALHGKGRKLLCGLAATIFSIVMYASPLSIMVPNGFGCGLGATQLVLYFIYRDRGSKKPTPEESIEMGLSKPNQNNKQLNANGV
ncbi:Bidirectional sugar transporter SWEET1 [Morus notabilis]|uniref:Bidirectional sugar transporter SWEET1 n=1 Tax=Morus notabilis TaxID=981085 RepID=W9SCN8_9ROSA|nr:Bidirectional sugar transporter SWEET1 [Morus notabilis]